jgi:hypothetical protein
LRFQQGSLGIVICQGVFARAFLRVTLKNN